MQLYFVPFEINFCPLLCLFLCITQQPNQQKTLLHVSFFCFIKCNEGLTFIAVTLHNVAARELLLEDNYCYLYCRYKGHPSNKITRTIFDDCCHCSLELKNHTSQSHLTMLFLEKSFCKGMVLPLV